MLEISGYVYDSARKRYFKIDKQGTPGFITQNHVDTTHAARVFKKALGEISTDNKLKTFLGIKNHICRILLKREISCAISPQFTYNVPHNEIRKFQYQQTENILHAKTVLHSPCNNLLHTIDSSQLRTYNLFWDNKLKKNVAGVVRGRENSGFYISNLNVLRPVGMEHRIFIDIKWCIPGHQFVLLSMNVSGSAISTITYSQDSNLESYQVRHNQLLPFNASQSHFVTPLMMYDGGSGYELGSAYYKPKSTLIRTRNNIFITNYSDLIKMGHVGPCSSSRHRDCHKRLFYTACCEASLWNACDVRRKSIQSVDNRPPLIYVAGTQSEQRFLYLTQLSLDTRNSMQLIKFNTNCKTNIARGDLNSPHMEITSLQCIGTSHGDRMGLLVGRRSGLLQLWDDRYPKSPAVEYAGSDGSAVYPVASHIPPQPAIDPVCLQTVAAPLLSSPYIGIWDIRTGEALNVCQFGDFSTRPVSRKPPSLVYRTQWDNAEKIPCKGPALLVFDEHRMHCFYV